MFDAAFASSWSIRKRKERKKYSYNTAKKLEKLQNDD
jgi:hypothetical protein